MNVDEGKFYVHITEAWHSPRRGEGSVRYEYGGLVSPRSPIFVIYRPWFLTFVTVQVSRLARGICCNSPIELRG